METGMDNTEKELLEKKIEKVKVIIKDTDESILKLKKKVEARYEFKSLMQNYLNELIEKLPS